VTDPRSKDDGARSLDEPPRGDGERSGSAPLAHAASPYPLSRLAPRFDLVDAASEIARADAQLGTVVNARLQVIREQVRALQEQAKVILEDASRAADLHRARCAFQKVAGRVYHLYRRPDGERYFSMLAPAEWGASPPHPYEGSYRLGPDMGWTAVDPEAPETDGAGWTDPSQGWGALRRP
jgi:hypothetical protein